MELHIATLLLLVLLHGYDCRPHNEEFGQYMLSSERLSHPALLKRDTREASAHWHDERLKDSDVDQPSKTLNKRAMSLAYRYIGLGKRENDPGYDLTDGDASKEASSLSLSDKRSLRKLMEILVSQYGDVLSVVSRRMRHFPHPLTKEELESSKRFGPLISGEINRRLRRLDHYTGVDPGMYYIGIGR